MKAVSKRFILLLLATSALWAPLAAQESFGIQGNDLETFPDGLFGPEAPRPETSARVAAWNASEGLGILAVRYVYPEGYHQIDDDDFFTLIPEPMSGVVFGPAMKGEPVSSQEGLAEYLEETTVIMEFRLPPESPAVLIGVDALFQICDENGICLFPDSEFHRVEFDPAQAGFEAEAVVQAVLEWNRRSLDDGFPVDAGPMDRIGSFWFFILMALLGGILLNVMPCVLPLLSVKALGLVKQAGSDRKAILRHSWLYVAGIEVSFWVLAAIIIALQTSGRLMGWGFQFQSPSFVLMLTAIIWIFALSMFDVFVIEAPKKGIQGATAAGARGGYLGSFLTGIFAVLVATPCTAPFLGAALGFAFSQPPAGILMIFSVIGIGLGLPFLILGLWPGLIERLPKPGSWMRTFKEVMGFLLIATGVYLFTIFARLVPGAIDGALWWILFLGFAAWLLGKARHPGARRWFRYAGQIAALAVALGSGFTLPDLLSGSWERSPEPVVPIGSDTGSIPFDEADMLSRIDSGTPVFLEFTAAWCTTCTINRRVINDDEVRALMKSKGVVHVVGDLTAYDEKLTRWLASFGRVGVPLYVLYRPGDEPHLFPEFIGVEGMVREISLIED